jgi:hypothetical protein
MFDTESFQVGFVLLEAIDGFGSLIGATYHEPLAATSPDLEHDPEKLQTLRDKVMRETK